jgi:hypothetical protein
MGRGLKREELLLRLESLGWPSFDMLQVRNQGQLARQGTVGPGKEPWLAFCEWADSKQMGLVVDMLVYNPAMFKGGTPASAPKPPRTKRRHKAAENDDELAAAMREV